MFTGRGGQPFRYEEGVMELNLTWPRKGMGAQPTAMWRTAAGYRLRRRGRIRSLTTRAGMVRMTRIPCGLPCDPPVNGIQAGQDTDDQPPRLSAWRCIFLRDVVFAIRAPL